MQTDVDFASTPSVIGASAKDSGMQKITAYCGFKNGGSGGRPVESVAEAEKILKGGYGVTTVRLETADGEVIGERTRMDYADDKRIRWNWWFDQDYFK